MASARRLRNRITPPGTAGTLDSVGMAGKRLVLTRKRASPRLQVNPNFSQRLVNEMPITMVDGRTVACDGGQ